MLENCVVFTSLIQRDAEFKETILKRMEEVGSSEVLQPCFARSGEASTGRLVAPVALARQTTHESLKPTNLRESAWKDFYMKIMKTSLQEEGLID